MLIAAINKPYQEKFNPLDFIVVYLYKHNPKHILKRAYIDKLCEIPFVQEKWMETPRKELPLSARLTKHEAATIIQSGWRGYITRKDETVQDFRVWQREVKEEKRAANVLITCLKGWVERKRNYETTQDVTNT
ncbi:IQ domain-containing protein K-like [Oopsacas minuta]|uniref:IQ domain-containing protein K-like n=1 Tax=Oopsacas minuta TaxID=111878 RepID=A0AAV7K9Z1_9METZ|nr:IQ domain-containing protein K-like [Oopsacas minuta]